MAFKNHQIQQAAHGEYPPAQSTLAMVIYHTCLYILNFLKNRISSFVTGAVKYGEMPYQDFRWQQHTSLPKM